MRYTTLLLCASVASVTGCGPADRSDNSAATVTAEQFQQLGWIAGKWRGAEAGGAPFFESYSMLDDSTLGVASFSDSAFTSLTGTPSMISLRDGRVTNGDAVVTQWDAGSIHFEPRGKAMNSYTWRKETPDRWTARLHWNDKDGTPRERTYVLTRVTD
ncbi:MAG: hypothetical protein ABI432_18635 [Flavobacteriales bacterium]